MIVLEVQTPQETTSRSVVARRFPFKIGRHKSCDLVLSESGVWDHHAVVELQDGDRLHFRYEEGVNTPDAERRSLALKHGMEIQMGMAKLVVRFEQVSQKDFIRLDRLVFYSAAAVMIIQLCLIVWLNQL